MTRPKLYLAGPDVFRRNAEAHGQALKAKALKAGFTPLWPLDCEKPCELREAVDHVSAAPDPAPTPRQQAVRIFAGNNVKLLQRANGVLANIEPFRGPGMDAGTAWEIGMAWALGKPVFAYTADSRTYAARVTADNIWQVAECSRDLVSERLHREPIPGDGPVYLEGMAVENFGLADNLMIACSVNGAADSVEGALALAAAHFKDWMS